MDSKNKNNEKFVGKFILTKLVEFGKFEIFYPVRRIAKSIKRSYDYAKQGWNSHDWDDFHLYDDITFKVKRMRAFFASTDTVTNDKHCKQTVKEMDEVLKLLDKVPYDPFGEYYDKYEAEITKKYGKLRMYTTELEEEENTSRLHMMRDKEDYTNAKKLETAQRRAWTKAFKERERDKKKVFELLNKHIDGWWD